MKANLILTLIELLLKQRDDAIAEGEKKLKETKSSMSGNIRRLEKDKKELLAKIDELGGELAKVNETVVIQPTDIPTDKVLTSLKVFTYQQNGKYYISLEKFLQVEISKHDYIMLFSEEGKQN